MHDSITSSRGHTVVSLGQGEEAGCGDPSKPGEKKKEEMCPKHPDQPLLLHCSKCKVKICFQCKLTQHEGHPTQDFVGVQAKVKASLQGTLGKVERQMQQIDQVVLAAEDRCSKLQQQQQKTEQELKHHADTLHQWVDQVQDEAVASVQSVTEGMVAALQGRIQQLRNTQATLQAQRDHTMRVLKDGKDADMASLESQLNAGDHYDVNLKQVEKELITDIPTFDLKRNSTAVNPLQLRSFVGVLDPVQQSNVSVTQETVGTDGSDTTQVDDRPVSAVTLSFVSVREKNAPREIVYSRNPQSVIYAICPISKGRLWISYTPGGESAGMVKLFDVQGQVLGTAETTKGLYQLYHVGDDKVVAKTFRNRLFLVKPDGCVRTFDMNIQTLAHCSENGQVYLREDKSKELWQVKFSPDSQQVYTKENLVFKAWPENVYGLKDVSPAEQYFSFNACEKASVYTRTTSNGCKLFSTYTADHILEDLCFCRMSGKEVLLVTVWGDNKVHVVDHTDGCLFLHYLDTGHLTLDRPYCLATDYHRQVWIGCHGGKVVVVNL